MINAELARVFDRIADLLEIAGGDPFRLNSYRRVARAITDLTDDVADYIEARLERIDMPKENRLLVFRWIAGTDVGGGSGS